MATIIEGDRDVFNTLCGFKLPDRNSYSFMSSTSDRFKSTISAASDDFFSKTREIYRRVDRDESTRKTRAALNNDTRYWNSRDVMQLSALAELQNAPDVMLPSIMAQPTLRKMFLRQRCDGYSDRYENVHGNQIMHNHSDYQRVMTGVWHDDPTDGPSCYTYDLAIEDVDFAHDLADTNRIRRTWDALEDALHGEFDPTSRFNSKL